MNQKGEVTLMTSLLMFILMGIVLLSSLELKSSYRKLQRRTELFLCVKETKEEINLFIKFIGRTNWAIKNINRAKLIMMFLPLAPATTLNAQKLKNFLIHAQNIRLISYLNSLKKIKAKGCQLEPRLYITPFELSVGSLKRDQTQSVNLRKKKWNYIFYSPPYTLNLKIDGTGWEDSSPRIKYFSEEKMVTPLSTLP